MYQILIRNRTDDPTGRTERDDIRRNVTGNHASRADNAVFADGHARHNGDIRANPYVILNDNRQREVRASRAVIGVNRVSRRADGDIRRTHHAVADGHAHVVHDGQVKVGVKMVADGRIASIRKVNRRFQPRGFARAAEQLGIYYNTGEGGLHEDFYVYGENTIVQVASGRFGVHKDYLEAGAAVEIKMGQGAKPGIGGHLPGAKIVGDVSKTRMIPEGSDAISPAPHHDIYSIEDLRQLVYSLKEATEYKKPIIVKVAAVHNIAAIASGIARSGADIIAIDGFRGGTGAAPTRIRDNVGIPIELALAAVDQRLRDEGIRNDVSLVVGGSIRSAADIIKAVALGADACYVATAALMAMGCHLCRTCQSGKCNWGIATQRPELVKRLNPDIGSQRLVNLMTAWKHEIKEFMGGMGINSIESLRGNRLMLRGVGLNGKELEILGISHAGE